MPVVTDPFSEIHDAIWTLIEANTTLAGLVKTGNRIKLDGKNYDPFKSKHSNNDFPEIIIIPSGGQYQPVATSDDGKLVQNFDLLLNDGDLVATRKYFPVKWQIIKTFANVDGLLGLDYVKNVQFEDITDSINPENEHEGWRAVFRISVLMFFSRTYLKS
ncbi:hypothetical protein DRH27_02970 [Candidatus Falkowbacteria bacterium]|nr:MAG: hypothetical protein DRH27_02970 [Candidatus Falkowbacteria bacterium]